VDLVEVDCVDREATTSAIFDFLPDRIGTFLTSYGLEVALHSIHAHGDAINERERLRVLRSTGVNAPETMFPDSGPVKRSLREELSVLAWAVRETLRSKYGVADSKNRRERASKQIAKCSNYTAAVAL
jgi:hypothetical protein